MKKIRWTDYERKALIRVIAEIESRNPGRWSDTAILREAQATALPLDRRRKITYQAAWASKALIAEGRALASRSQDRVPEPAPQPEPAPAPTEVAPPSMGELFEALVDAVADRILLRLMDAAPQLGAVAAAPPPKAQFVPPNEVRLGRPGVLVIGLLGMQAQTIERMFPQLDITAMDADEALRRDMLRRAHTILMTKFINHSVQDKYRKASGLQYCNGGVTELAAMLSKIPTNK